MGGGINDFAENIKLRRKLQRFRRRQPWSAAREAIFRRLRRPLQMRRLRFRRRRRRRRTPTDIQIIDLRAEHVCARERERERE